MDLRHLRYFVAVAETLHFGRAGQQMFVAQSAISQQIKALEEQLGVVLFERTRRSVALTTAGKLFLTSARSILRSTEEAMRLVQDCNEGMAGNLNISFVYNALWWVLPSILSEFHAVYPSVGLQLRQLNRVDQLEELQTEVADLAIVPTPHMAGAFESQHLVSAPLLIALPNGHPLAEHDGIPLTALMHEPFVLFPSSMRSRILEIVQHGCANAGFAPRVVQEAEQMHTLLSLVGAGLGVTLVPQWVAAGHPMGVSYVNILDDLPPYGLNLVSKEGNKNPAIQRFREIAAHLNTANFPDPLKQSVQHSFRPALVRSARQ